LQKIVDYFKALWKKFIEFLQNKFFSNDEYYVIDKFIESYRNQNVIIADSFRQDFEKVPLEEESIIFKTSECTRKIMDFCRRIYHNGKPYIIMLSLWRAEDLEGYPKCLSIREFKIITKGKVHSINLNIQDTRRNSMLFNIISIFDERKIISPEQAYCKQMYTDKALQVLMINHEWKKINEGIKQSPSLAHALFIIKKGYENYSRFTADFGTILYQLISYRQNNQNNFDEKDLYELDKLILKLSKTDLLKVQLYEEADNWEYRTPDSILLNSLNYSRIIHISKQYNVANNELTREKRILNNCIRNLKR